MNSGDTERRRLSLEFAVSITKRPTLTSVWIGGCCTILLFGTEQTAKAQPIGDARPADEELRRRLAPLIPSFRAALQGDSVDAQRATLAVIADIPPALAAESNLAAVLAAFLRKDIKDPEVIALGIRSFGRSYPDAPDIDTVLGRHVRSEHAIIRRAVADALSNAVANSTPSERAVVRATYFIDVSTRAVPHLTVGIEDKDPATQKLALGGIQATSRNLRDLFAFDTPPIGEELKPKDREARFGPLTPVLRALAAAVPKLATPLTSNDTTTRIAAARTLEILAQLRRTIRDTRGLAETEVADPFVGGWSAIKPAVSAGIKDNYATVRLATTEALETLGDAIEARALLREATSDKDLFVRWAAARALGRSAPIVPDPIGNAPDVAALAKLVSDTDIDVRSAALNAIAKFGRSGKSASSIVLGSVSRGDVEPRVAAVKALGAIESDSSTTVPVLIKALQHNDVRLRRAAASGLIRFGPEAKAALPDLHKALSDPDPELRLAASEAILAIEIKKPREL